MLGGLGTSILTTSHGVMTGRAARKAGVLAAVSSIPQKAEEFGRIAQDAGADLFGRAAFVLGDLGHLLGDFTF